ncbi:MAG: hypothetical protein CL927_12665 [Deltaproteobacteria bacterium]|nr:hypothetical protein [Deltaproteobacteria bacterium]HCH63982.1 hypothetical protein [Deltaproteobacteria bacterium]
MTVLGVLCTEGLAQAGELNQTVIRELLQASGWEPIGNDVSVGLSMYEKPLKSVGLSAYMGVRDLPDDVDPDRLWAVIIDIDQHVQVGDKLVESKSFGGHAGGPDSYQVLRAPRLLAGAQRYWFVHSHIELDVEGTPGRNRRCWSNIPPGAAAAERARVQARYPDATPITLTHGCWEVLPAAPGAPARLRYLTVSDPGGALARTAVGMLTTRTLPENIANFVDRARR